MDTDAVSRGEIAEPLKAEVVQSGDAAARGLINMRRDITWLGGVFCRGGSAGAGAVEIGVMLASYFIFWG